MRRMTLSAADRTGSDGVVGGVWVVFITSE
jgi:hypothetical protein